MYIYIYIYIYTGEFKESVPQLPVLPRPSVSDSENTSLSDDIYMDGVESTNCDDDEDDDDSVSGTVSEAIMCICCG